MTGTIESGWEFVIAAYSLTWLVLIGYAASLWVRGKSVAKNGEDRR
ncbi:MAG: hypothetical protein HYV63_11300 [Candidatus Schekmanbacteria bacterium]|nr:hypothetical protein [Candidatus Schekmanbacteria bacterium]